MPSTPDTKPKSSWSTVCDQVPPVTGEESWGGSSCGITAGRAPAGSQIPEAHVDRTSQTSKPVRRRTITE